jgi:hypothetical protein
MLTVRLDPETEQQLAEILAYEKDIKPIILQCQ